MATEITPFVRDLIKGKNFAHLATLMPDGSPQNTPVWIDIEEGKIVFNTAEGRTKPRNIRRDPRVAISIVDSDNPYRAAFIRGRVTEMTPAGGDPGIDRLAKKYMGVDTYPNRLPSEVRLQCTVEPDHIATMG